MKENLDNLMHAAGRCTHCYQSGKFWFRIDGGKTYHANCGGTLELVPAKPSRLGRGLDHLQDHSAAAFEALLRSPDLANQIKGAEAAARAIGLIMPKPRLRLHTQTTRLTKTTRWCVELMGCDRRTTWWGSDEDAMRAAKRGDFTHCVSTDRRANG